MMRAITVFSKSTHRDATLDFPSFFAIQATGAVVRKRAQASDRTTAAATAQNHSAAQAQFAPLRRLVSIGAWFDFSTNSIRVAGASASGRSEDHVTSQRRLPFSRASREK